MSEKKRIRLRQIVGRDSRVIKAFLGIIEHHEKELLIRKTRDRVHGGNLEKLTLTALRVDKGEEKQELVPHDFKKRFPRMSHNEFRECKNTAVQLYDSYLQIRKKNIHAPRPTSTHSTRRIPRQVYTDCFSLYTDNNLQWTVLLRNSMDSVPLGRRIHDKLRIPLKASEYHQARIQSGEVKALHIFTDKKKKWWVTFIVRASVQQLPESSLPVTVLGIDLGIKSPVCTALITPKGVSETKLFHQKEKDILKRKYIG